MRPIHRGRKGFRVATATMALAELAEKGTNIVVLHQVVRFMAQRLMELDVEARCSAG